MQTDRRDHGENKIMAKGVYTRTKNCLEKLRKQGFKNGKLAWNWVGGKPKCNSCGKKLSIYAKQSKTKKCNTCWKSGLICDSSNSYKGSKAGYRAIHKGVERRLGTPRICSICKTREAKRYHWSNIDHKYNRSLKYWIRLCVKCHKQRDVNMRRVKK